MSEKKWKDHLLRSSLPLEHVVAEKLQALDWMVWGQYTYSRKNPEGLIVDFSVDLRAIKEYSTATHYLANFDVLIECKYASPGVRWVFLPWAKSGLLEPGIVGVFDEVCNKRVRDTAALLELDNASTYCIRGVSLSDSGCDEAAISRGAAQLRYAKPNLVKAAYEWQAAAVHDADLYVEFLCAILVTTAPIYCLKSGITISDVQATESLDEIAEQKEFIVLWEDEAPDRIEYTRQLFATIEKEQLNERLAAYAGVYPGDPKHKLAPSEASVRGAMERSCDHVLVTTLEYLPILLSTLNRSMSAAASAITKIAEIEFKREQGVVWVEPVRNPL